MTVDLAKQRPPTDLKQIPDPAGGGFCFKFPFRQPGTM